MMDIYNVRLLTLIFCAAYVVLSLVGYALLWRSRRRRDWRQGQRIIELEIQNAKQYEAGVIHGYADCEAKWRDEPLYKRGYERCIIDRLEAAAEMDAVRQSGILNS